MAKGDKIVDMGDGRLVSFPGDMPDEHINNYLRNSQPTQFEQERTGQDQGVWAGVKRAASAMVPSAGSLARRMAFSGIDPVGDIDTLRRIPGAAKAQAKTAGELTGGNLAARVAGGATGAMGPFVGVDPERQRAQAEQGRTGEIIGESAVPAAATVAGYAGARGLPAVRRAAGEFTHDPLTGKTVSPYKAVVNKVIPDPNMVDRAHALALEENASLNKRTAESNAARLAKLNAQAEKEAAAAEAEARKPVPVSKSPGPYRGPQRPGVPGTAAQEAGYQPPLTRVPIRPQPPSPLTPEQVPGPDTAGKGNLLTPAARRGDPRAQAELMRRGRPTLAVPAEEYPGTRLQGTLEERMAGQGTPQETPFQGPERRDVTPAGQQRRSTYQMSQYSQPTEGEQLADRIRTARAGTPSNVTEGEAMQYLMRDPNKWDKFRSASSKEQGQMLVEAKNRMRGDKR